MKTAPIARGRLSPQFLQPATGCSAYFFFFGAAFLAAFFVAAFFVAFFIE